MLGPWESVGASCLKFFFSYSLEGLAGDADGTTKLSSSLVATSLHAKDPQQSLLAKDARGSLVSLTEEELESEQGEEARGHQVSGFLLCFPPSPATNNRQDWRDVHSVLLAFCSLFFKEALMS